VGERPFVSLLCSEVVSVKWWKRAGGCVEVNDHSKALLLNVNAEPICHFFAELICHLLFDARCPSFSDFGSFFSPRTTSIAGLCPPQKL
jgi:hypothetical protein